MNLHKKIERSNEKKQNLKQDLVPSETAAGSRLSPRAVAAITCVLVVAVALCVCLPIVFSAENDADSLRFCDSTSEFDMTAIGFYINPAYVGQDYADQNNGGICLEEYCLKNRLDMLSIPRNDISIFYADEQIAYRETYLYTNKEDPSLEYWQEKLLSPDTTADSMRPYALITLTILPQDLVIRTLDVGEESFSETTLHGILISHFFTVDASDSESYTEAEFRFAYGGYKYYVSIRPNEKKPWTSLEAEKAWIYMEDILSALN